VRWRFLYRRHMVTAPAQRYPILIGSGLRADKSRLLDGVGRSRSAA